MCRIENQERADQGPLFMAKYGERGKKLSL